MSPNVLDDIPPFSFTFAAPPPLPTTATAPCPPLPSITLLLPAACATANYAFHLAASHIRAGEADVMICGGAEAPVNATGLGGFVACRALSSRNEDPTKASRPWDNGRDGFVLGEGAGVLVFESMEHASGVSVEASHEGRPVYWAVQDPKDP